MGDGGGVIPPDQIATSAGADNVTLKQIPLANMHLLRYNTNHPLLADKGLRRAKNLAIDRRLLIDTLWGGRRRPCAAISLKNRTSCITPTAR